MSFLTKIEKNKIDLFVLLPVCLIFFFPLSCKAKMVSINREKVNIRSGPSTHSKIKWVLGKGFPLRVLHGKGNWLKVQDFEKEIGWVYAPLTSKTPHLIVKLKNINVRGGPGTNYRIVARAQYGVVFRTIKQIKGWAKVKHESGIVGWVARKLVWGW